MIVILAFVRLYAAQKGPLSEAEKAYGTGAAMNLAADTPTSLLAGLLSGGSYVKDPSEAGYLAGHLVSCLHDGKGGLEETGDLNRRRFDIVLDSAGLAGAAPYPHLMERIRSREEALGVTDELDRLYAAAGGECPPVEGKARKYRVRIRRDKDSRALEQEPVLLRIEEHWNEFYGDGQGHTNCVSRDSLYAYVKTAGGRADLLLPARGADGCLRYFSVLPVRRGFEYGQPRGTVGSRKRGMTFVQRTMSITPLDPLAYRSIREDHAITVRTPDQYRRTLFTGLILFVCVWLLAFGVLAVADRRKGRSSNLTVLAIGALLSGIGLVNLFSITADPLTARLYGWGQLLKGVIPGVVLLVAAALFDWKKWYDGGRQRSLSDTSAQGLWVALCAVGIAVVMAVFGTGPVGSGAKVNLSLGGFTVQGAPVIRLCLAVFCAVFLANKENLIAGFATRMDHAGRIRRLKLVSKVFFVLLAVIAIQVCILSDLGQSLVVMAVAVAIYSIVRRDFARMVLGTGSFIALLLLAKAIPGGVHPLVVFLVWAAGWIACGYFFKKAIYESAVLLALLITAPACGDLLADAGFAAGERLVDRVEMAHDPFDNEVSDQLAQGRWAIAAGGLRGRLDETSGAAAIPAGHTDMVLCSLAEGWGLVAVTLVVVLLLLLVHLGFEAGIGNGSGFCYFLSAIAGLSLAVEAAVISLGSLGLIPLSGLPYPFLSFGASSLCIDFVSLGIILYVSGEKNYKRFQVNTNKYVGSSSLVLLVVGALLLVALFKAADSALFRRGRVMTREAVVRNTEGVRVVECNPRIAKVMDMLRPGDIRDRNGIVLATSAADSLLQDSVLSVYEGMGLDRSEILARAGGGHGRTYPLGVHTLFLCGDSDRKLLWGDTWKNPAGLNVESHCYSFLRGYDNRPGKRTVVSTRHHSPYLPDVSIYDETTVPVYDYTPLVPMMRNPSLAAGWNARRNERDVRLTIDARLQVALNRKTERFAEDNPGLITDYTIISFVLVDGTSGDVLTSSCYPLPDPDQIAARAKDKVYVYRDDRQSGFRAYVDRDPGMTVATPPGSTEKTITAGAGFRKYGVGYASSEYDPAVLEKEVVDISLGEPTGRRVSLRRSLVESSNVGFIKRAAGENLYPEMGQIWWDLGVRVGNLTPYYLYPDMPLTTRAAFMGEVEDMGRRAVSKYNAYVTENKPRRLIDGEFQESWGQGRLSATPLSMARYMGACGNGGVLMRPRYLSSDTTAVMATLMDKASADTLASYLRAQAGNRFSAYSDQIGGKTGTPVREFRLSPSGLMNDAWYVFYFIGRDGHSYGAALRMTRVKGNSKQAMAFTGSVLLPTLKEFGYL